MLERYTGDIGRCRGDIGRYSPTSVTMCDAESWPGCGCDMPGDGVGLGVRARAKVRVSSYLPCDAPLGPRPCVRPGVGRQCAAKKTWVRVRVRVRVRV